MQQPEEGAAAGLLPFLDILRAAGHPGMRWTAAELAAAFQWASTVQRAAGGAADPLRTVFNDAAGRLPPWLAECGAAVLKRPRALLLAVLLQRLPPGPAWFQLVLGGYVSACVLPERDPAVRAAAERDLAQTLAHLGQQQLLSLVSAALVAEAAVAGLAASVGAGENHAVLRAAGLRYFTSGPTLAAAAAAQLLLQGLESGAASLQGFLGTRPGLAEAEVMCLALLVPAWEAVLARLQQGSPAAPAAARAGTRHNAPSQGLLTVLETLTQHLCTQCRVASRPLLLQLPPALLAEVCRESFSFTVAYSGLLERCQAADEEGLAPVIMAHTQQLLVYDDVVAAYAKCKLQIGGEASQDELCM